MDKRCNICQQVKELNTCNTCGFETIIRCMHLEKESTKLNRLEIKIDKLEEKVDLILERINYKEV